MIVKNDSSGCSDKMLAKNTGKSLTQIEKDSDRDYYISAEEAVKYGIVDKVLT